MISIGYSPDVGGTQFSQGWIWTDGDNGVQEIEDALWGVIEHFIVSSLGGLASTDYHIGVKGFRGIQVTDSDGVTYFEGYAKEVKIS